MDNIPFMKPYLGNNARTCPQSTSNNPVFVRLTGASDLNFSPPLIMWRRLAWARHPGLAWDFSLVWGVRAPGAWSLVTTAPAMRASVIKCLCLFCTTLIRSESERMLVLMTYCDCFFWYLANVISFHLQFPVSRLIMQQNHDSESLHSTCARHERVQPEFALFCVILVHGRAKVMKSLFGIYIFLRFYFVQFNQLNLVTSSIQFSQASLDNHRHYKIKASDLIYTPLPRLCKSPQALKNVHKNGHYLAW